MDTLLPHERLDAYIRDRADQLGIRLKDVADALDVSEPTLVGWRRGVQRPTLRYAQRLDRWMGWRDAPSSTLAVLDGGKPIKERKAKKEPIESEEVRSVIAEIEALPNLSREQRDVLIEHLKDTVQSTRERAVRWNDEQAG